jgi:hypothetical protein
MARGLRPNELVDLLNFGRDSDLSSLSSDEEIVGNFPEKEFEYLLSNIFSDYDFDLEDTENQFASDDEQFEPIE